jgi:hypothetical protein
MHEMSQKNSSDILPAFTARIKVLLVPGRAELFRIGYRMRSFGARICIKNPIQEITE